MPAGKLEGDTAANRVYRYLKRNHGQWFGGWQLTIDTHTTAISTRLSEIRHQVPANEKIEVDQDGTDWFYRLCKVEPTQFEPVYLPGMEVVK